MAMSPGVETAHARSLSQFLHPVGYSDRVGGGPLGTSLLGVPIGLGRDTGGVTHALHDLCAHRGTALSLGSVANDEIECPYHGWRFAGDGRCTRIPQLDPSHSIPARARVGS